MGKNVPIKLISFGLVAILFFLEGESLVSAEKTIETDSSLVLYWNFDEKGPVVKDASPNKNDGKILGVNWVREGKDYAIETNNKNGVAITSPSLDLADAITVSAWFKQTERFTREKFDFASLVHKMNWPPSYSIIIEWPEGNPTRWWIRSGGKFYVVGGPKTPLNEWIHAVGTYDSATGDLRYYINGTLYSSDNIGPGKRIDSDPGEVRISGNFPGMIDEVMLFKRALSVEEIAKYYKSNQKFFGSSISLRLDFKQDYQRKDLAPDNRMYLLGEKVTFTLKAENGRGEVVPAILTYQIREFLKGTLLEEEKEITIPAKSSVKEELVFPPPANGIYYLKYSLKNKAKTKVYGEGRTSFSVIPEPEKAKVKPEDSPFGFCQGWDTNIQDINIPKILQLVGMRWWRVANVWTWVEPEKGVFNWKTFDKFVEMTSKHGIQLMPVLTFSPLGAFDWPAHITEEEMAKYKAEGLFPFPPRDKERANSVTAIVSRYKDKIKAWQDWNEPSHFDPETGICRIYFIGGTPERYVQMLKTTYVTARKADPESRIVGIGEVGTGASGLAEAPFSEQAYKAGGLKYADVICVHPYPFHPYTHDTEFSKPEGRSLSLILAVKEMIDKYGGNQSIWLTELGWMADDIDPDSEEFVAQGVISTEENQANYLVRLYVKCLSLGYVEKFFWFTICHPAATLAVAPDSGTGLLRHDYTAKPSFLAHRTLVDELEGAKPISKVEKGHIRLYTFERDGKKVSVAWRTSGSSSVSFKAERKITLIDIMNNLRELNSDENIVSLLLTESPVFIEGEAELLVN